VKKNIISNELKWALSYLKPYYPALIGITILAFGQNYSFALLPRVSTNFLFELITPEKYHLLFKYFFIAVALITAKAFFEFFKNYSMHIITHSAIKKLRDDFFTHLITLDLGFFNENKTGNIISIGVNDIEKIRTSFYQGLVGFLTHIMMLLIIMVKLFLLNWKLTLISTASLPILYIVVRLIGNKMRAISRKLRENLAELSINLHETITGIEVVKSFAKEEAEIKGFKINTKRYKKTFLRLSRLSNLFGPLNEMIIFLFALILIGIGSFFIIREQWNVKGLTEYLMLLGIMSSPITRIPEFISKFKIVTASIERVYKILSIRPKIKEEKNPIERRINGEIEFKNVWFYYKPENYVLKGVSFKISEGEIVALVGPSGAGKSTIANLIPRFYDTNDGEILIDNINVKKYSLKSLRSQIGIVSQNVILFNTSILENIRYAKPHATESEIIEAAKKAYAYDFIMDLPNQFETEVGEKGVRLSGGQKQRISIARTILMDPQILILDEATSSLDSESEYYIQLAINKLMEGRTSVIIAHRLSTITHATKIIVLDKGIGGAIGKHEDLLETCELYNKIYNLQYFR